MAFDDYPLAISVHRSDYNRIALGEPSLANVKRLFGLGAGGDIRGIARNLDLTSWRCHRRFKQQPQAIGQFLCLGRSEHFVGSFVGLAGIHDLLGPFLGLVEFAFQQVEPRQADASRRGLRRSF